MLFDTALIIGLTMKIQKKKDIAKSNRLSYVYALAVALVLGLAHKVEWIEMSSKKQVTEAVNLSTSNPKKQRGRSYYRANIDRKKRLGDSKSRRNMSGCETLCWSVEEWYRSVIELLKAQEMVRNNADQFSQQDSRSATLQNLEKEWDEARTNMRLRRHDGAHCLVFFVDKVEYCRAVVSGDISLYEDVEVVVKPICRRYLHMAKEYEEDATQCLKGYGTLY